MSTTNPVYQVLIPKGNQAILGIGLPVEDLAPNQFGIFNYHTNLSVSAASPASDLKEVYFAVGIDRSGSGELEDINKSAGQVIQVRNAKSLTLKGYMAAVPKIIDITGYSVKCETDYIIKVEFRNQKIYAMNGYNQFTKSYSYYSGCCADQCVGCGAGDPQEVAIGLVTNINKDPDGLVTASLVLNGSTTGILTEPTADGNTTVTIGSETFVVAVLNADTPALTAGKIVAAINADTDSAYKATDLGSGDFKVFAKNGSSELITPTASGSGVTLDVTGVAVASNLGTDPSTAPSGVGLGIRLTANPAKMKAYVGSINFDYQSSLETDIYAYLTAGFECNGTVTTVQELVKAEGKASSIKDKEYVAGGWNGKPGPYRLSDIRGSERDGFEYFVDPTANYTQISLTYDQFSVGGWLEYLNNLETIIAIACADTTTLTGLFTVLDAIFTQFGAMTNDAALVDCTNTKTGALTPATDGIESLS